MALALFRVRLADGSVRLARGDTDAGPAELLDADLTLDAILATGAAALDAALRSDAASPLATSGEGVADPGWRTVAPVEGQEVWAAGVTYERSRDARMVESAEPSVYDRVYGSDRPELFLKAPGWRVRGPGEPIAVRADSGWDVPEPELALVVASDLAIVGYTIGNDVSSRTIEGENPLYLPQAKLYDGACALGPGIVPATAATPPFAIRLEVLRGGAAVLRDETSSARLHRSAEELVRYLGRALSFPVGAVLLTGTGIVPGPDFSLRAGDRVRIEIEGIGRLENPVVSVGAG